MSDLHRLSKNQLAEAAWPDKLTPFGNTRPAAAPAQRFTPPAAAPGAPTAPMLAADLRRAREELGRQAWPDNLNMVAPSQQGDDDADPDAVPEEQEIETLEFAIKANQDRLAILRERVQAKSMSNRAQGGK